MKLITIIFSLIIFTEISFSQQSEYVKNAKSFEFEKIKLGFTYSNFISQYPNAIKIQNNDESIGVLAYRVDDLKSASYGFFTFYNNRLFSVSIIYNEDKLNSIGGWQTLLNRLKEKLGNDILKYKKLDEENKTDVVWWDFDSIQRYFEVVFFKDGDVSLLFTDDSVRELIRNKKAKNADIGF